MNTLKPGTRIEVNGWDLEWRVTWEAARILKPRPENLPLPGPGWHIVKFDAGGTLCVHENRFRVVDNGAP